MLEIKLNITRLEEILHSFEYKKLNPFGAPSDVIMLRRKNNRIIAKSVFCKAIGEIVQNDQDAIVNFKFKFQNSLKIVLFIVIAFLLSFVFLQNVTINGEFNPSFIKRLVFFAIGLSCLIIPLAIFHGFKRKFKKKVEEIFI